MYIKLWRLQENTTSGHGKPPLMLTRGLVGQVRSEAALTASIINCSQSMGVLLYPYDDIYYPDKFLQVDREGLAEERLMS
jgi:hypothetical protein